ncbi:MAG: ribosome recycling factor [Phycisphaeraceae bacterium]|nr:MAG: ribosome recycling factor [Phycisphaeraceae bacterium]
MDLDSIQLECEDRMNKTVEHLQRELRGIRTGRASTALVDYVKVDYYGSPTDLRELAQVSVPEPTQILIKPYDPGAKQMIIKAIEIAALGFNPMSEGNAIRINVPAPSADRRKQLVAQVRKIAEESRVAIRNERRDANKHIDTLVKDKSAHVSEDQAKDAKNAIEELTKQHIARIDELANKKAAEVETL